MATHSSSLPLVKLLPLRWITVLPCLAIAASACAGERAAGAALLPAYREECGSCHVPYPPRLLPAASWQRLLGDLPRHFGSDASLDAGTLKTLSDWLGAHAGTSRRAMQAPPQDRITRSAWFIHEHGEVAPATWRLPAVKSPANCAACHTQADQGDFSERRLHIPR
jgi:hypothetical protein